MNASLLRTIATGAMALVDRSRPADDLVDRLRSGNVAALGEAYDRYHEQVRGFARRLVGDNAAAEDLVQSAFIALPAAMRNYRGDAALGTFVLSIVVNHARHHVRAASRRRRMLDELTVHPHRMGADPERDASRKQVAAALARALDTLPLEDRVAFVLCDVEDRPSAEAAKILGVPDATVRSRLFRARRRMREQLDMEAL